MTSTSASGRPSMRAGGPPAPASGDRHVERRDVDFYADDGRILRGTWFTPQEGPVIGVVVIAPAMATPAMFYRHTAEFLASHGQAVLTFDYRGVGSADLRSEEGNLIRWAHDGASALEHAATTRNQYPGGDALPITWVGHSFGGQILSFLHHDLLSRSVLVATGHGHYRNNPPALRRKAPFLWRVIVPVTTRMFGYFPGRRLGILDDLPTSVVKQWGRWCLHPGYWEADIADIAERHAQVSHPIAALAVRDDEIVAPQGLHQMIQQFVAAPTHIVDVWPDDFGVERIGHHGLFRRDREHLWPQLLLPYVATRDS